MTAPVGARTLTARAAPIIGEQYRGRLTLERVAAAAGCSPRSLQRAYAETHTSFSEELRRVRLSVAAELLASQSLSVEVIARLSGFAGAAPLSAAFRRRYGLSPACYRAAARAARPTTGLGSRHPWPV